MLKADGMQFQLHFQDDVFCIYTDGVLFIFQILLMWNTYHYSNTYLKMVPTLFVLIIKLLSYL